MWGSIWVSARYVSLNLSYSASRANFTFYKMYVEICTIRRWVRFSDTLDSADNIFFACAHNPCNNLFGFYDATFGMQVHDSFFFTYVYKHPLCPTKNKGAWVACLGMGIRGSRNRLAVTWNWNPIPFVVRHSPFRLEASLLSSCWAEWKWNGQCACSGSRPIFSLTRQCVYIYVCMYYIAMYIRWIRMQMKSRQLWRGWANLWPNFQRWLSTGVQICGKNARWALAFGAVLSFKWN